MMKENKTEVGHYSLEAVFAKLSDYCYMAKEHDYIEVTEWHNGEGYDIDIETSNGNRIIKLTHGELAAINALVAVL